MKKPHSGQIFFFTLSCPYCLFTAFFFCILFLSVVAEQVFVYAEQAVDILSTGSICEHQGLIAVCIDPSVISWCSLLCRPANNQHPLCACSRSLSSLSLSFPSSSPHRPVSCLLPQRQAPLYHCSPAVQQEQRRRLLAPWERSGGNGEGEKVGALLWKWHGEMSMRKKNFKTSEGSRKRCMKEANHEIKKWSEWKKSPGSWGKRFRKDKITHAQNWSNYGGKAG